MEQIKQLLKSETPVKWLFAGDSITHGVLHTFGERDYVQLFEERLRAECARYRDVVIKTAVTGWTTKLIRENIDWHILQFDPHAVFIMIGMNDALDLTLDEYVDNYNFILDQIASKTSAKVVLQTQNPVIPGTEPERAQMLPKLFEKVHELGGDRGIPVIDHYGEYMKAWNVNPYLGFAWMADQIHPNTYGHRAFARLLFKELGIWDEKSRTCNLLIP